MEVWAEVAVSILVCCLVLLAPSIQALLQLGGGSLGMGEEEDGGVGELDEALDKLRLEDRGAADGAARRERRGRVKTVSSRGVDVSAYSNLQTVDDVDQLAVLAGGWESGIGLEAKGKLLEPFVSMGCNIKWLDESDEALLAFPSKVIASRALRTRKKDPCVTLSLLRDLPGEKRNALRTVEIEVPARPRGDATVASRMITAALGSQIRSDKKKQEEKELAQHGISPGSTVARKRR
jgi:hypothetical protein